MFWRKKKVEEPKLVECWQWSRSTQDLCINEITSQKKREQGGCDECLICACGNKKIKASRDSCLECAKQQSRKAEQRRRKKERDDMAELLITRMLEGGIEGTAEQLVIESYKIADLLQKRRYEDA